LAEKRKVTVDGEEFEVEIQFENGKWEVSIQGETYQVEMDEGASQAPKRKRGSRKERGTGSGLVSSAIPGKIVSVLVSEEDSVETGSVVIVLEAMKMQNEIKSSIDGRVKKVMCKPGERIEANVPLMEIVNDEKDGE
tara:strand:- start:88 stop:498 length:411 start_codon:yes stop_codon:yes gene_type:complete